ncbi:protein phosphatase 2C [Histomonas meleagridis]|uniref:protein phosphatase 2C n=1 Tax=Histomonas meleagridis TaxID=135588 RepID=UPI00355A6B3F|nr:protein phosphatase 2C [Histomonas meleagridis]KAH0805162.1 protein phosphatase 2C [Histomonas meleagridis]
MPGIFYAIYRGKVCLYVYSFSYDKWVCTGYLAEKKRRKVRDENGKEFDTSITIMLDDDTTYELYLDYDSPPKRTAKEFVEKHKLSQNFIPQIKEFIELNVSSQARNKNIPPKEESGVFADGKIQFGTAEMKGKRNTMQDFSIAFEDKETNSSFFCIFDGHGSEEPSQYAGKRFKEITLQLLKEKGTKDEELLTKVLMTLREEMTRFETCGTCAVCVFIKGNKMWTANLGDSRCLLCWKKDGENNVQQLSVDHKASDKEAVEYAEKNGGHVVNGRISNILAVSRFIGDSLLAAYAVAEPSRGEVTLQSDVKVLMACDGVFDVITNEEVADMALDFCESPVNSAVRVRDKAFECGSLDNISVIVVQIQQ